MIVRIQFRYGRPLRNRHGTNRPAALAGGAMLIPIALMAYVMGFWSLASDIGVSQEFAVRGLFSHWQLWIVTAVALNIAASVLTRYGRGGEFHLPRALTFRLGATPPAGPDSRPDAPRAKVS